MGQIIGNALSARNYKAQATVARSQGRARQAAYDGQARNLEEEARADSRLSALSMGRQRENQANAQATARVQRASSGFTAEGSGLQNELSLADIFEKAIGDMALSNAISDNNKRTAAMGARQQGRLAMMQADAQATQYNRLAKSAQNAAWIQGGTSLLSAAIGGIGAGAADSETGTSPGTGTQTAGSTLPAWAAGAMSSGQNAYDLTGNVLQWSPGVIPSGKASATNAGNALTALLTAILGKST